MPERSNNGLTDLQAKVIELRDEHGLTFREIGGRLGGKNQGNIYRIYQRGKNKQRSLTGTGEGGGVPMSPRERAEAQLAAYRAERKGKPVTDKTLLADIEATLAKALYLLNNDVSLAETRAKDLTTIVDKLIEKRQLLKGEPTAITGYQDVRKLDEVAKRLHAEMERRGLLPGPVIDVTPEDSGEKECATDQQSEQAR